MQLFRQQALDHQNRLHGDIFMVPPLRWQAIGWLLMLLVVAGATFLALGSFNRTVQAQGTLHSVRDTPGPAAPKPGTSTPADGNIVWRAKVDIPLAQLRQIHPDQRASLTVRGFPSQDYGILHGTIIEIGAAPAHGALTVPVTLQLSPATPQQARNGLLLRDGQPVEAAIVVERISLWRWLFDPVLPDAGR